MPFVFLFFNFLIFFNDIVNHIFFETYLIWGGDPSSEAGRSQRGDSSSGSSSSSGKRKPDEDLRGLFRSLGSRELKKLKPSDESKESTAGGTSQRGGEAPRGPSRRIGESTRGPSRGVGETPRGPSQGSGEATRGPSRGKGQSTRGPSRKSS